MLVPSAQSLAPLFFGSLFLLGACTPLHVSQTPLELRYPIQDETVFKLDHAQGDIAIKSGTPGELYIQGNVLVKGEQVWAEALGQRVVAGLSFHSNGQSLELMPPIYASSPRNRLSRRNSVTIDYTLYVPPDLHSQLSLNSGSIYASDLPNGVAIDLVNGDIKVEGVSGKTVIRLTNGSISAKDVSDIDIIGEDVLLFAKSIRGDASFDIQSGEVSLIDIQGTLDAKIETGSLRLESALLPSQVTHLNSVSGSVDLFLPEDTSVNLCATSLHGKVYAQHPSGPMGVFDGRLETPLGPQTSERAQLDIHSESGSISIFSVEKIPDYTALKP